MIKKTRKNYRMREALRKIDSSDILNVLNNYFTSKGIADEYGEEHSNGFIVYSKFMPPKEKVIEGAVAYLSAKLGWPIFRDGDDIYVGDEFKINLSYRTHIPNESNSIKIFIFGISDKEKEKLDDEFEPEEPQIIDSVGYDMAGRRIIKLYRWKKENPGRYEQKDAYIAIVRDSLYNTKNSPVYYTIIPQSCDFDPKTGHYFPTAAKNIPMKNLEDAMNYVEKTWPKYEEIDFTGKLPTRGN